MPGYIELKIAVTDSLQKEMLIAQLSAIGIIGFEEEKNLLKAFIKEDEYNEFESKDIIKQYGLTFSVSIIEDINWNAEWEAAFKPVVIANFCTIRAGFHEENKSVKHDIIITPKMSFGTAHHATTYMMVEEMENLEFTGKAVFDFGTGTGVLAILAEKSGAGSITAIDNDDWSINNAIENFNSNNCSKILLFNSQEIPSNSIYDIILANINRNIILQNLETIKQHLATNGVLLLSGLLTGDEALIIEEARKHHLRLKHRKEMDGWICLVMINS
ncbi:MAG: 50S ribosomal protein L11 methyltransferase [Chitinophagaceae bacterium]